MLDNGLFSTSGLVLRPARAADAPFLEALHRTTRPDLEAIAQVPERSDTLLAMQYRALQSGAGNAYPNAMHFVIEKSAQAIGGLIVDFGHNEVRVVYLALLPAVRGNGYARIVLQGVQQAATKARCPVAVVVWRSNSGAKRLYQSLGFVVEEAQPHAERMVWYPDARPMVTVTRG